MPESPIDVDAPVEDWVVWEWATGIAWRVIPPTPERARYEANLIGQGHDPMPRRNTVDLQRAFANGRMFGHKQAKEATPRVTHRTIVNALLGRLLANKESLRDDEAEWFADDIMALLGKPQ